jgi:hypothetical protein
VYGRRVGCAPGMDGFMCERRSRCSKARHLAACRAACAHSFSVERAMKKRLRKRTAPNARTYRRSETTYALRHLGRFLNKHGWRPSASELAMETGYRSRWWWWRTLRFRDAKAPVVSAVSGLVRQARRGAWELTKAGWEWVGMDLQQPLLERKPRTRERRERAVRARKIRRRLDMHAIFESHSRWSAPLPIEG